MVSFNFVNKFCYINIYKWHTKGSDRHDVALYSNTPPNVNDLLNELEKKTRVPKSSIQLIFKGQKLHNELNSPLSQFGIFSGNKLQMVGERVSFFKFK